MNRSMYNLNQKEKTHLLEDQILEHKLRNGRLPEKILIYESYLPDECKEKMEITIDDTAIPILILEEQ